MFAKWIKFMIIYDLPEFNRRFNLKYYKIKTFNCVENCNFWCLFLSVRKESPNNYFFNSIQTFCSFSSLFAPFLGNRISSGLFTLSKMELIFIENDANHLFICSTSMFNTFQYYCENVSTQLF